MSTPKISGPAPSFQYELFLPRRPANDVLADELGLRVEHFNEEADPLVREQLLARIRHLRDLLGEKGGL
jgi:hypothetical protein